MRRKLEVTVIKPEHPVLTKDHIARIISGLSWEEWLREVVQNPGGKWDCLYGKKEEERT